MIFDNKKLIWVCVVVILLFGVIGIVMYRVGEDKGAEIEKKISIQNYSALVDSIEIIRNSNKELIFQKSILVGSVDDLRHLNLELYQQVQSAGKKVKVAQSSLVEWKLKFDSLSEVKSKTEVIYLEKNGLGRFCRINYLFQVDSLEVFGHQNLILTSDSINSVVSVLDSVKLKLNIRSNILVDKELYKVQLSVTGLRGIEVNQLNAWIDKDLYEVKPSRWGLGIVAGGGVQPFDIRGVIPFVGVGIFYKLL